MTIRELTCLVRLFQACTDPALRRRAIELVPELSEWDKPVGSQMRLYAVDGNGPPREVTQKDLER